MPINSRTKGANGEREFAAALHAELGVTLARNLEQVRNGGHDLVIADEAHPLAGSLGRFAIECKRYAGVKPALLARWWKQAAQQAQDAGKLPCLAFRADRQPWGVIVPLRALSRDFPTWTGGSLDFTAMLTVAGFAALVREVPHG